MICFANQLNGFYMMATLAFNELIIKNCKDSIKPALLSSIESLCAKYDLTKDTFTVWYDTIISKVEERISHLMVKFTFQKTRPNKNVL